MSVDVKRLRELAEAAPRACALNCGYCEPCEDARSRRHDFSPQTVIALLDEIERLKRFEEWTFETAKKEHEQQLAAANAEIERLRGYEERAARIWRELQTVTAALRLANERLLFAGYSEVTP